MPEKSVEFGRMEDALALFGSSDANIRLLEEEYGVRILLRDTGLRVCGESGPVGRCARCLDALLRQSASGREITAQSVTYLMDLVESGEEAEASRLGEDVLTVTSRGRPIRPRTVGQQAYLESIRKNTVTLGIGPAGTGKTYLAVAAAVRAFRAEEQTRIILTRPAVEAGEKLGFLPGDLQNKVDPYLRPLYDALFDIMGPDRFRRHQERGNLEVAPLAYMRGRTLDDSFIILDEAQNTTPEQMKMFLTRLGLRSKAVITGDITQIDLPGRRKSGLVEAEKVLRDVPDIGICRLTGRDVVRHRLVQRIIRAYDAYHSSRQGGGNHGKT